MSYRVNHLHHKSPNPELTARWYIDYLGAKVLRENRAEDGRITSYNLDLHGVPLNVTGLVAGQQLDQHWGLEHMAIDASNFDAEVARIKASGTRVLEERVLADGRRVCFFEGPEGVRLEFMEMR